MNCGKPCDRASLNCEQCRQQLYEGEQELERELRLFVGKQYPFYKRKWEREQTRKLKWSWNGWAAFFNVLWLGYRGMYRTALLFLFMVVIMNAVSYYIGWNYGLPIINTTPAALLLVFVACIGLGFFANQLYYQHAIRRIYKLKAKGIANEAAETYLLQTAGGTRKVGIALLLAAGVVLSSISHRLFPTDLDIVNTVRNGSLYNYPLYSIGESFEQYFHQPSWQYYRAPDGLELVEFHGFKAGTERTKIVIQFLVDYQLGEIEPYSLEINGVVQEEAAFYELMDSVYSVQNPFELDDDLDKGDRKSVV